MESWNVKNFTGNEAPDKAKSWFHGFTEASFRFDEKGTFRFLSNRIPYGSLAREWFNGLDVESRTSWPSFEHQFHRRWGALPTVEPVVAQPNKVRLWCTFCDHRLEYEGLLKSSGLGDSKKLLIQWVTDHRDLALQTDRDDEALLSETKSLIPGFIRVWMSSLESEPTTFDGYCDGLIDIPSTVLKSERQRYRESEGEWRASMEDRMNEMLKKMDQVIAAVHAQRGPIETHIPSPLVANKNAIPPSVEIDWEPCSPLTSVESHLDLPDPTTPLARPAIVPLTLSGEGASQLVEDESRVTSLSGVVVSDLHCDALGTDKTRIPTHWRNSEISLTKFEVIAIAKEAIEYIEGCVLANFFPRSAEIPNFKYSGMQCMYVRSSLALMDQVTSTRRSRESSSRLKVGQGKDYAGVEDIWHGISAALEYRTYGTPASVKGAINSWDQLVARVHPSKYYLLDSRGGVAPVWDRSRRHVNASSTISYMVLSAYLSECTGDAKYLEAAILSIRFIQTYLLDIQKSVVVDRDIDVTIGTQLSVVSPLSVHLTGLFVEGLAVLATVTHETKWEELVTATVTAAVNLPDWHSPDGVLSVDPGKVLSNNTDARNYKGLFIRGLHVAYQRNTSNLALRKLIRNYINLQFNALWNNARFGNTYGWDWSGPYLGPDFPAQIAALDVLVATAAVND